MNYDQYKRLFDEILANPTPAHPYDAVEYMSYTKLNRSRMRRWDKQLAPDELMISELNQIASPQHWVIISEPWCGDAAHIIPFLIHMTQQNTLISYEIQLRDTAPFLIESYLTNGSRSIPKLIVRDDMGKDIFAWGPRPVGSQQLMEQMKAGNADFETIKIALQNWYNNDKGRSLYRELLAHFTNARSLPAGSIPGIQ